MQHIRRGIPRAHSLESSRPNRPVAQCQRTDIIRREQFVAFGSCRLQVTFAVGELQVVAVSGVFFHVNLFIFEN